MKSKNTQLIYFVAVTLLLALFANVNTKHNEGNYNVVWDNNDNITTEAQDSNAENVKVIPNKDNRVSKVEVKETAATTKAVVTNSKVEPVVNNLNNKEKMLSKLVKTDATVNKVTKAESKPVIKKTEEKLEKRVENTVSKKVQTKPVISNKDNKDEYDEDLYSNKVHKEERLNTNNIAQKKKAVNTNFSKQNNTSDGIKFESVKYVRQLSPAGKAALEAQESGE